MCYSVYVSTTSDEDLSVLPPGHFHFVPVEGTTFSLGETTYDDTEALAWLTYPHKWYLSGRHGGCSCHFRHWDSGQVEPTFERPVDWFPEDQDDVDSTNALYDELARIVQAGHQVDLIDTWNSENLENASSLTLSMSALPRDAFRFFLNVRFDLTT